jgi:hypothetical protein
VWKVHISVLSGEASSSTWCTAAGAETTISFQFHLLFFFENVCGVVLFFANESI